MNELDLMLPIAELDNKKYRVFSRHANDEISTIY